MNYICSVAAFVTAIAAGCSCSEKIPAGCYTRVSGDSITDVLPPDRAHWRIMNLEVRGCEVYMHVHTETNERHWEQIRAYQYDILRHNTGISELSLLGSSNDAFFLLAVVPYTWSWDDGFIKRVGRGNGKVEEFGRLEETP